MLLLIRAGFGFRIFYGVIDNVVSWDHMLNFEKFLSGNGFPIPLVCAVVSVYLQFFSSLSWMVGYQVKISSVIMILNFAVAIIGFHVATGDTYLNTAPALHLLIIAVFLFFVGPGNISLDQQLRKKTNTSPR
ncbi:MAG: DoxX family protein [Cyclobacteriaceae bacterium]